MVLEALAISIGKALSVHLFTLYLKSGSMTSNVTIEGAPEWYYQEDQEEIATFASEKGGLASIEKAKKTATNSMKVKIDGIIEAVLYDYYKSAKTKKEKLLISRLEKDEHLGLFVRKHIRYPDLEYIKENDTSFIKASIDKDVLIDYEKNRLQEIKKKIQEQKAEDAFTELEEKTENPETVESKEEF